MMDQDRGRPLQRMFQAVPPSYDFLNRLLTCRFDEHWRKKAAAIILEGRPQRLLDICTGTGDLAMHLRKMAPHHVSVTALDYSAPMLQIARQKAEKRRLMSIEFVLGDVASLPFETASFDAIGIAFAFRNLTFKNPDTDSFLSEIFRVLRPGGRFVIAETSQPRNRFYRKLIHAYLRNLAAPLGGMISGQRGAYHYLAHSAIHYDDADGVKRLLSGAGFSSVSYQLQLGGVSAIWVAEK